MARSFILLSLLKEARDIEVNQIRRQLHGLRRLHLLTRDEEYIKLYRLSEALIDSLEVDLHPHLAKNPNSISTRVKLLCTLSFLATGSFQKQVGRNASTSISQTSASRCIHAVVEALNHPNILKKYIRFPQTAKERQDVITRFYEKLKMPGVLACIDGTLVAMVRPVEYEERYYCRKGYYARNVQLVTDADLNILHVDASYGGATHDSFIFNYSELCEHIKSLVSSGHEIYLLGDSGYSQRSYMMTPVVPTPAENSPEAYYNKCHAYVRNSVEKTIGILKGRFRCLLVRRVLHYHPDMVAKIVNACCVLHNICNHAGIEAPVLFHEDLQAEIYAQPRQDTMDSELQDEIALGLACRRNLISHLWHTRTLDN